MTLTPPEKVQQSSDETDGEEPDPNAAENEARRLVEKGKQAA